MVFIHVPDDVRLQLLHISEFPKMFCILLGFLFVIEPAPVEVCRTKEEKQEK
jgi:hypothetical protein